MIEGVMWALTLNDEPADTIEKARQVAALVGNVIVPVEPEDAETGTWLCNTDDHTFDDLKEFGWLGLEGEEASAEAEWPDV